MDAKIDGVVREQAAARVDAAEFRAEVKTDVANLRSDMTVLRSDVTDVSGRVDILDSKQKPKTPWYVTVGAVVSIVTVAILIVSTIVALTQVAQALQH